MVYRTAAAGEKALDLAVNNLTVLVQTQGYSCKCCVFNTVAKACIVTGKAQDFPCSTDFQIFI